MCYAYKKFMNYYRLKSIMQLFMFYGIAIFMRKHFWLLAILLNHFY